MGYLIPSDHNRLIQEVNLSQIISGNSLLTTQAEIAAIEEAKSYLRAKYDVDSEFSNTQEYNPQSTYSAGDRVYLNAPFYNPKKIYIQGQLVLKNGIVYQCNTAVTVAEEFDNGKWTALGSQYTIFYANYPEEKFDIKKNYEKGDKVFWKNKTYECIISTAAIDHATLIQYDATNNVPYKNIFPNDPKVGSKFWNDLGTYTVPAGNLLTQNSTETVTLFQAREDEFLQVGVTPGLVAGQSSYVAPAAGQPGSLVGWDYSLERILSGTMVPGTDYTKNANGFTLTVAGGTEFQPNEKFVLRFVPITDQPVPVATTGVSASQIIMTYFTQGDNRNQQLVVYILDMLIYHLYRRIPPSVVPEIRVLAYQTAISWLGKVAKGDDIVASIEKLQPPSGSRIRYGSRPKQQNFY